MMIADRISEELELFVEDSEEQLGLMEQAILECQDNGVDDNYIGALFRAMHTIKGTAGMFGFDAVVEFTHVGENLLSEVREGTIELIDQMLDVLLQVKDHTQILIDNAVGQQDNDAATIEETKRLEKILESFMQNETALQNGAEDQDEEEKSSMEEKSLWHISMRLNPDFYTNGLDILEIINYLYVLGNVTHIFPVTCNIPHIKELNPTEAFLGYEIILESDFSKENIEDVFEYVKDDITLDIISTTDFDMLEKLVNKRADKISLRDQLLFFGCYPSSVFKDKENKESIDSKQYQEEDGSNINNAENIIVSVDDKAVRKESKNKNNFSLRVDSSKIDQLINQISEMVIANAKIAQRADILDDTDLSESANVLSDMLEEIRTGVMNIRMVQVGDSFNKFKRIVRDVAKKLDKEIDFEIVGGETELDKMVVEKISDPIMHMLRNSIDHGIESRDERIEKGKTPVGKVILKTYPDAGTIVIEISDDGKGLDKERILQKAINNGLVDHTKTLSDKEIFNLIFSAGLSTAQEVSDISGRGVGMDVVKQNIESLRGTIEIDSKKDEGSVFTIRLPLTLAIIDGFLVQSGDTKYIVPLEMIQECIELDQHYKQQMKDNEFINLRDTMLPLLDIRTLYKEGKSHTKRENVVVVRYGDYKMGLRVDELYGEFQTVIKPLGEVFKNVPGISGGTLLGSGEIALIFDIPKLIEDKIKNKI